MVELRAVIMNQTGTMNMPMSPAGAPSGLEILNTAERRQRLDRFLQSVERRAFKIARLRTSDTEEALDIVQDVMLAFVRRYQGKPEGEWPPLFFRALNNRITDWYRRRAVRNRWSGFFGARSDEDESDPIQTAPDLVQPGPAQQTTDGEFGEALNSALAELPDRQREAFLLRSWQGLSTAETAAAMGCGEGSVKTHLSRANSALRQLLERWQPGHE